METKLTFTCEDCENVIEINIKAIKPDATRVVEALKENILICHRCWDLHDIKEEVQND